MIRQIIARTPGRDFANGLTTSGLGAPSYELACKQHDDYLATIKALGIAVDLMPALEGFPDACFVEDTAIVTEELAVITMPGAKSRVGEIDTVAEVLKKYKKVEWIKDQGATIDGGDVLLVGNTFFVGMSDRTNKNGMDALAAKLVPFNRYKFVPVEVGAGLHLKSSVTQIAENTIIIADWLKEHPAFKDLKKVTISNENEYAANTLLMNGSLIMTSGFPDAVQACKNAGCKVVVLDMTEYRKMDGALTCLSLRF